MTPERWERLKTIFGAALATPPSEREAFLSGACDDEELQVEARKLLAAHESAGSFIEESPLAGVAGALVEQPPPVRVGRRIGPYRLLAEIGRGGMGTVYRAVRDDDQYHKEVALKLVQESGSRITLDRFLHERQILAGLDHPQIARLLDGGTTDDDRPYLVMDLVEGEPIDEYCRSRALGVRTRLELFRAVCAPVQYAHQNLVVHRDIKPGNILVTGEGTPKLLDFGIAKLLRAEGDVLSPQATVTQLRALTLDYASPEQVRGQPITTGSDVYSLGVLLYELLTGRRPHASWSQTAEGLERAIREQEPPKPSTVAPELRGDLDNILLMALRKEPARRYPSVEQFSEDVRRYLTGRPVIARKDTVGYRAGKFVGRHRFGVAAATLFALTLLGGIVGTLRQARIANAERLRAEKRFGDVRALANSLMFEIHDSIQNLPGASAARKLLLERALRYLDSLAQESGGDSALQRELAAGYQRIGELQGYGLEANLGDTDASLTSLQKALAIWESVAKANPSRVSDQLKVAYAHRVLSTMFDNSGRAGAREQTDQALTILERLHGVDPSNPEVELERAISTENLAYFQETFGDAPGAVESMRKALAAKEALWKLDPQNRKLENGVAKNRVKLGNFLARMGSRSEPLELNRTGLDLYETLAKDPTDARSRRELAVTLYFRGNMLMIEGEARGALEVFRRSHGILQALERADPTNALYRLDVAGATASVGRALAGMGQHQEGLAWLGRAVLVYEQGHARDRSHEEIPYWLGQTHTWRAEILSTMGDPRAALDEYQKAASSFGSLGGERDDNIRCDTATSYARLGSALAPTGKSQEATAFYTKALKIVEPLAASKTPNLQALQAAADAYAGLAELSERASDHATTPGTRQNYLTEACDWYGKSVDAWERIPNPGRVTFSGFATRDPKTYLALRRRCSAPPRRTASQGS